MCPVIQKHLIEMGSKILLITDGWSSVIMKGYLCITAHWLEDWTPHLVILKFVYFPSPHTGSATADLIFGALQKFGILSKVMCITTNNGSNIILGCETLKEKINSMPGCGVRKDFHLWCIAHVFHIVIKDGLADVKSEIEKIRKLIGTCQQTAKKEVFEMLKWHHDFNKALWILEYDTETMWDSTFTMLNKSYQLKAVFNSMCNDDTMPELKALAMSTEEWDQVHHISKFLQQVALQQSFRVRTSL